MTIQRMWQNGPLRHFLTGRTRPKDGYIPYRSKELNGWAGSYVCENCNQTCDGVYQIDGKWIGGCCKSKTNR